MRAIPTPPAIGTFELQRRTKECRPVARTPIFSSIDCNGSRRDLFAIPSASNAGKAAPNYEKAALNGCSNYDRRDEFQAEILSQARVVDTASAEVEEVEQALADLELLVAEQRDDLTLAERALEGATLAVTAAERTSKNLAEQQSVLSDQVNELALQTYIGRDSTVEGSFGLARTGDIYKAARVQTLIGAAFGDINNSSDELGSPGRYRSCYKGSQRSCRTTRAT